MSIYSVKEVSGARTNVNDKGISEYSRKFKVITTAATVGAGEVRTANGIPRRFDAYATATETDNGSVCTRVSADQDEENPVLWVVTADYGSPSIDADQASEPNPVLRPAVVSWSFNKSKRAAWRDADGNPSKAKYMQYVAYKKLPFSVLGLP